MTKHRKHIGYLTILIALIALSPIDEIILSSLLGTVLFPFGSVEWILFVTATFIIGLFLLRYEKKKNGW